VAGECESEGAAGVDTATGVGAANVVELYVAKTAVASGK